MRPLDRVPPPLLAVTAIFSVQLGSAFARSFFEQTGALGAAALRLFFGSILLALIVRPRVRTWDRRTWLTAIGLGVALAGMNSLIYLAIDQLPIGVAVTVEFLGPLGVSLAQTRRRVDAAWALLALAGVALLGLEATGSLSWAGLLLAALAAAFWAGYILTSARLGSTAAGLDPLAVAMLIAAIVVVPVGAGDALPAVTGSPWLLAVFVLVALLTSVIPYSLEFVALKRMPTRVFGVLSSLGPGAAALAGLVVLHEALGWEQLLALALVTAASVGVTVSAGGPSAPVG